MMTAILIDDEKNALDVLSAQLKKYCPEVNVLARCQNGEDGILAIKTYNPSLIFLDIEMPKVNGFDVLNQTKGQDYKVIFTTAYDSFAIKAFKYSTIDYLLKPIDIEELIAAVKKLSFSDQKYNLETKIQMLLTHYQSDRPKIEKIALPIGNGYEMIPYDLIIRCESDSNYTTIFLADKRKVILSKTLKDVEQLLPGAPFYRIHHSHLVNLNYVAKFFKTDGGYIVLNDGMQISIGRSRKDKFFEMVKKL